MLSLSRRLPKEGRGSLLGGRAESSPGLGRSARPHHGSNVSTSTHRPYCSVYSDPSPRGPGVSEVHPLGQWLFDDFNFFSL